MYLKELLNVLDGDTVICICDEMGPHTEVKPLKDISIKNLLWIIDRKVERVYFDPTDNSITIELEDIDYEEGDNQN